MSREREILKEGIKKNYVIICIVLVVSSKFASCLYVDVQHCVQSCIFLPCMFNILIAVLLQYSCRTCTKLDTYKVASYIPHLLLYVELRVEQYALK